MSILVDTNVFLRRVQPGHEQNLIAIESLARLGESNESAHFTLQNISEFWNVATRPVTSNGLGFSVSFTLGEVEKIERLLTLLPDTLATYSEWKRLVVKHGVMGVKVHDARLVAIMNIYNIDRLLTFNGNDFVRFGINVIHPASTFDNMNPTSLTRYT